KQRRHESKLDADAVIFKIVDRAGRLDIERELMHRRDLAINAHEAITRAVDADHARQRLRLAGPVLGRSVREMVGHRPNAEIWIDGNQRHGWGAESLGGKAGKD